MTVQPIPATTTAGDDITIAIPEGFDEIGVVHFGAEPDADVWVRVDGTAAAANTAGNYRVPAGAQRRWKVKTYKDGRNVLRRTSVSVFCDDAVAIEVEFS